VNKTRTTTILLVVLTLAGCSSGFQYYYYKPNTTQQQYDKDAYECNKEATDSDGYGKLTKYGPPEAYTNPDTAAACLKARGYTITYK
jgi:hypothetical protein